MKENVKTKKSQRFEQLFVNTVNFFNRRYKVTKFHNFRWTRITDWIFRWMMFCRNLFLFTISYFIYRVTVTIWSCPENRPLVIVITSCTCAIIKRCTRTYLKDDTEAHYPRSIHHLVHDIIQSFLAANGILQEIKTLDHINMHTSLRPRKLSTFIVIVRHDDEHGHHAARHSNVFVYSSPRHNYDKTSENTIRNTG